ncbi:unnamed protein product [Sphagnum balticum]
MSDAFKVRQASEKDVPMILDVHCAAVHGTAATFYDQDILNDWSPTPVPLERIRDLAARLKSGEEIMLVAENIMGQIIGFGSIFPKQSELRAVYVHPNYGKQGLGSRLLKEVEYLAKESGLLELSMDASTNAERFYLSHGYQIVQHGEHVLRRLIKGDGGANLFFDIVMLPINEFQRMRTNVGLQHVIAPALKAGPTFSPGFVLADAKQVIVPAEEPDPEDAKGVRIPEQGEQTYTFIAGDQVIRLGRSEAMSKIMAHEVRVMSALEGKTDLVTPKILDFRPDQNGLLIISRLPGEPLSNSNFSAFGALGHTGQDNLVRRMGKFLGQMHKLFPESNAIDVPWRDEVQVKLQQALQQEKDPEVRERLQMADQYLQAYGRNKGPYVMLHGDLHPGNVMFDPLTSSLGVIDFGCAKMGLAHRDFVKISRSMSAEHYQRAVEGYTSETGRVVDQKVVDVAVDVFEVAVSGKLPPRSNVIPHDAVEEPQRSSRHPAAPRFKEAARAQR